VAFTKILNDAADPHHVPGAKVVAAFKGGSADIEASASRIEKFTQEVKTRYGVELVESIDALLQKVDAVIITSVDGRVHLEQARPVLAARRRLFIDKPLAASARDAKEIVRLSTESGAPFFSASSLRFLEAIAGVRDSPKLGKIQGCEAYTPARMEEHHPDLSWYGIHGVEILFAIMGPGCESVRRWHTPETDVVTAKWKDGRLATLRGIRSGKADYGAIVYGEKAILTTPPTEGSVYRNLVQEIVKFFQTGVAPVGPDEMIEVIAFIEATQISKQRDGGAVRLDEVK
jgi:predicted dehydrogenase